MRDTYEWRQSVVYTLATNYHDESEIPTLKKELKELVTLLLDTKFPDRNKDRDWWTVKISPINGSPGIRDCIEEYGFIRVSADIAASRDG